MPIIKLNYPQVYFRVDHGKMIGDGHLFRNKALAAKMKEVGYDPIFVTRPHIGYDQNKFFPYKVLTLKEKFKTSNNQSDYREWLGVTQGEDVSECLSLVGGKEENIWIVDHYGIDIEWEKEMVARKQFVVSIDDLFRKHHSHIVIDHNLTADKNRYSNSIPDASFLMGPRYALLRNDICQAEEYVFGEQKSYLLFLGSVDDILFCKMISILRGFDLEKLVLLNPPRSYRPIKNEEVLSFCSDLPKLYEQQKMVFGACGVSHLERMLLGVPTVTCVVVENQVEVGKITEELGISCHIGDLRSLSSEDLKLKISEAIHSEPIRNKVSKGKNIISKNGVELVVKEIQGQIKKWQSR